MMIFYCNLTCVSDLEPSKHEKYRQSYNTKQHASLYITRSRAEVDRRVVADIGSVVWQQIALHFVYNLCAER